MKKLLIAVFAMVVALSAGQVFAASYDVGAATELLDAGNCVTRTIKFDGASCGTSPFVSGGFLMQNNNESAVDITACSCYDGALTPAVWDAGVTPVFDPTGYPGGLFVAAANLGAGVTPAAGILVCDVTFCGVGAGVANLCTDTVPGFDTWVGQDFSICDGTVPEACIEVTVQVPPCTCSITGPATVQAEADVAVTAQYSASPGPQCVNPPAYVYATDCTLGTIDPNTGVLTVPATTSGETCTIAVVDTANTDINNPGVPVICELPIEILGGVTCLTEIALGRFCPEGAEDDPSYNRPGRRGIAATCGDIIDFTVCSTNPLCDADSPEYDEAACAACQVWTITPNTSGSTIEYLSPCCWRLTIGDICTDLDKVVTEVINVFDSCCNSNSSVSVDIGKVIINLGETTAQPNTESSLVDVDMVNLDHSVRAITLDVVGCTGDDNLVCTQCLIDPDRTLDFTCSANEQADGSCRIVLYSTDPAAVITQGRGTIAQIVYSAGDELADLCGDAACIDLCVDPDTIKVSDQFNEDLCTCLESGEVCFVTCGDIFPQDCIGGTCGAATCCGDGVIDLFDILEGVDIILNLQVATACQIGNGDVPNGMPPYCGNPPGTPNCEGDGDIDIFDVLVMIDKALGKMNCCDYCIYGNIF